MKFIGLIGVLIVQFNVLIGVLIMGFQVLMGRFNMQELDIVIYKSEFFVNQS